LQEQVNGRHDLGASGILREKTAVSSARFSSIALSSEAAKPGARRQPLTVDKAIAYLPQAKGSARQSIPST
jgi:hypothetical protein